MKTWRLRVMRDDGQPLRPRQAFLRYCLAWLGVTGIALLWVLFDPERLFLHDRLAGTRLVMG